MHFPVNFRKLINARTLASRSKSESPADTDNEHAQPGIRRLPVRTQIGVLVAAAALLVLPFLVAPVVRAIAGLLMTHSTPADATPAPGTFKPTARQLETLSITPVTMERFQSEEIAEGNIAIDDDLSTPVFSPYSGRVTLLSAKVGDVVAKGARLMTVEAPELVQAQSDLIAAVGAADVAREQLTAATRTEQRTHDLYGIKGAALRDWQQAQADLASAQAAVRSAEAALAGVRNRLRILGKTDKEIAGLAGAAEPGVMNPEAVISAPIAGTVIQRQVGLGQYIQANAAAPVFAIGDLSKVWLIANVREGDAAKIAVGQLAEVRVPAYPNRIFKARISTVGPAIDPVTHRLPVRAEIDNPDAALRPQMFANIKISAEDGVSAVAVPESAIIAEGSSARVWVANADNSLSLREIRTGRVVNHMVEVIQGLAAGERIVTAGALFIDRAAQAD
jgi:membrane fusion protein, heavy metal efflux system